MTPFQHRRAQVALRARTLQDLLRIWPAFDLNNIRATWPVFEEAALLLTKHRGQMSSALAATFYSSFRESKEVGGSFTPTPQVVPDEQILAGLAVVGPIMAAQQLSIGRPLAEVAKNRLVDVSGALSMYVLNHGRNTLMGAIQNDSQVERWRRVTGPGACEFCTMLAGRGAVYKAETVDFQAHKHCACSAEPVFKKMKQAA